MKTNFFHRKVKIGGKASHDPMVPIPSNLNDVTGFLHDELGKSPDVVFRELLLADGKLKACVIYIVGLVQTSVVNRQILNTLLAVQDQEKLVQGPDLIDFISFQLLPVGHVSQISDKKKLVESILNGNTLLLFDGQTRAISVSTTGGQRRSIQEPSTEVEVRAPRESFVEYMIINQSMIRRKLKNKNLRFLTMRVGKETNTQIAIAYLHGTADPGLVEEVKRRINKIDIDGVLETLYIEHFIKDTPFSIFPQIDHTERPDRVCAMLLEGRIAILVDGTPWVLIVPAIFFQFLTTVGDYYSSYVFASFTRILRFIAFIFALVVPSLYIALTTMHQEMFPTPLVLQIAGARSGVPFPAIVEAVLMELSFELLREAGIRLPKAAGQAVSIVGALIIGEAAVEAGIVSPIMIIVVALTGISSFAIPSYEIGMALRVLRFPLMIIASILGIPGITVAMLVLLIYLVSLSSFGVPYLSPFAPMNRKDLKDTFIRVPWTFLAKSKHFFEHHKNSVDEFDAGGHGGKT